MKRITTKQRIYVDILACPTITRVGSSLIFNLELTEKWLKEGIPFELPTSEDLLRERE